MNNFLSMILFDIQINVNHFHDFDGDLYDHNVGKIFGLCKILTVIS